MKTQILRLLIGLLFTATALAEEPHTICESDGTGMSARLEFRPHISGQYEALILEYQGKSVLVDPISGFNHMGQIIFQGEGRVNFHKSEYSEYFRVTVPAFGGQRVTTARGVCRIQSSPQANEKTCPYPVGSCEHDLFCRRGGWPRAECLL